jgi:hypothetical protein
LFLEPPDRCREGLLREVESLSGAGEVQVVGDGKEVAHLAQLDPIEARNRIALVGHVAMLGGPPSIHNEHW